MKEDITYVYNNKDEHVEVKKTGRWASKTIPAVGTAENRIDKLIEITPVELEDGRWKKFVREAELLIVGNADDE